MMRVWDSSSDTDTDDDDDDTFCNKSCKLLFCLYLRMLMVVVLMMVAVVNEVNPLTMMTTKRT